MDQREIDELEKPHVIETVDSWIPRVALIAWLGGAALCAGIPGLSPVVAMGLLAGGILAAVIRDAYRGAEARKRARLQFDCDYQQDAWDRGDTQTATYGRFPVQ